MVNLDCVTDREALWSFYERHARGRSLANARTLFPERPAGYVRATADLANYACNKAVAMDCRVRGDIVGARYYEDIAGHIYASLPAFARW